MHVWPTNLTLLFSRNENVSRKKESSQLLLSQTAGLGDIDTNLDRTDRTLDRTNRTLTTPVQNGCNRTCVSNLSRITLESFHFERYRLQRHHVAPIYIQFRVRAPTLFYRFYIQVWINTTYRSYERQNIQVKGPYAPAEATAVARASNKSTQYRLGIRTRFARMASWYLAAFSCSLGMWT